MLHELLLALSGFPGSIFSEQEDQKIKVVGELPFLSASEEVLLNRLCQLATHYKQFQTFIKKHIRGTLQKLNVPPQIRDGLYLRSFCTGLDQVLEAYSKTLLTLEEDVLADPTLTVGHMQHILEPFQPLFATLGELINKLESGRYHGCQILDLLHGYWMYSQPDVREVMQRLLFSCHCVLFNQLTTWLLHGFLLDKHNEFFIHHRTKDAHIDNTKEEDDHSLCIGGMTGRQMKKAMEAVVTTESEQVRFAIHAQMLPSYMPLRVAEKILFAGESVQMFESKKQKSVAKYTDPVLGSSEGKFAQKLSDMRRQPIFSIQQFEEVINEIRSCVAEHLWTLVVDEHKLVQELSILKDFYLLGRGELFLAFIDQVQMLLQPPPNQLTEHYINIAFQQAAHKVSFDDDDVLSRFHITVPVKDGNQLKKSALGSKVANESGWHVLSMSCAFHWPIHILFTQSVAERYNRLFKFLLSVKRVQLELQQCWVYQMYNKRHRPTTDETVIWQLRSHMAFLVDNLQYYLQVDVLDTQFSQLLHKIESTRDFEAVRLSHDLFLSSLLAQCFLLTKPVHHCLMELLDLCHSFAILLLQNKSFGTRERTQVDAQAQTFNRLSSLLFKMLSGVKPTQSSPYLTQFLLRLDFNNFFSMAEGAITSLMSVKSSI